MLTLYHYWRSSCSWRVRWALTIKGVDFKHVAIDLLHDGQKSPDFLAINPSGFVPALVIDGKPYGESMALLEWIEETWPQKPLLPTEPLKRLRVRQLCQTIVSGTQPLQNLATQRHHASDKESQSAWAHHWIDKGLRSFLKILELQHGANGIGPFCFGDQITMADLCLVPQIYNAMRFNVDMTELKVLKDIYDQAMLTPACQAAAPNNQPGAATIA